MKKLWITFTLLIIAGNCVAQEKTADSLKVYKEIEAFAEKKKGIVYTLYRAIFRPVKKNLQPPKKIKEKQKKNTLDQYTGKIIRSIIYDSNDPFGYVIGDTAIHPRNFVQRAGNSIHAKTKKITIRNKLLFERGEALDPFLVKESERLLRQSSYIREVTIIPIAVGKDSVDIWVRTIDLWSIVARVAVSPKSFKIHLTERNFFGLGHELDNTLYAQHSPVAYAYEGVYTLNNIRNSYINTSFYYTQDKEYNSTKGINVERTFFSPVAQWAGGIAIFQSVTSTSFIIPDTTYTFTGVKYDQYDFWGAKSWRLQRGSSEARRTKHFIASARFLNIIYSERPYLNPDTFSLLQNQQLYLFSAGISKRNYFKDDYLFKFGPPEEVPIGWVVSLTGGYQQREVDHRYYVGMKASAGKYFYPGYAGIRFEYGTFLKENNPEQGLISGALVYFTNLYTARKWKFRQFFRTNLLYGLERRPTDALNINDDNGIQGFNSDEVFGTKKLVFTAQTQAYAPINFIGFRFAPFLYLAGALISGQDQSLFTSRFYTSIGLGLIIKNELLVLNAFQISAAFYPIIPGVNDNALKINPVKTNDFQFWDFDLEKPYTLTF